MKIEITSTKPERRVYELTEEHKEIIDALKSLPEGKFLKVTLGSRIESERLRQFIYTQGLRMQTEKVSEDSFNNYIDKNDKKAKKK